MEYGPEEYTLDDVVELSRDRRRSWVIPNIPQADGSYRFWNEVILCISVAEMFFPFVFFLLMSVYEFVVIGPNSIKLTMLTGMLIVSILFGVTVFLAVIIFGNLIALFVSYCCSNLQIDHENPAVAGFAGGLVGIVITSPFVFAGSKINSWVVIAILAATLLGQFGGYRGAVRALRQQVSRVQDDESSTGTFRFGLRQVMILTAWLAALLTLLKLMGLLTLHVGACLTIWGALQICYLGYCLLARHRIPNETMLDRST